MNSRRLLSSLGSSLSAPCMSRMRFERNRSLRARSCCAPSWSGILPARTRVLSTQAFAANRCVFENASVVRKAGRRRVRHFPRYSLRHRPQRQHGGEGLPDIPADQTSQLQPGRAEQPRL